MGRDDYSKDLTPREKQVFDLLVYQGLDNVELAGELRLAVRSVKFHVGNILRKFRMSDRQKLVVDYWRKRAGAAGKKRPARPAAKAARPARKAKAARKARR